MTLLPLLLFAATPLTPAYFEENVGQSDPDVLAIGRFGAMAVEVLPEGLRVKSGASATLIGFDRARAPTIRFEGRLTAKVRSVRGDRVLEIPAYGRLVLLGLWPGVELALGSKRGQLAFDLVLAPRADPTRPRFTLEGQLERDRTSGSVIARTRHGVLGLEAPATYQTVGPRSQIVPSSFVVRGQRVGFDVGAYDAERPLIIDPVVEYATYLPVDPPRLVADGAFLYVAHSLGGTTVAGDPVVSVAKIDPSLSGAASLVWATSSSGNNGASGVGANATVQAIDIYSDGRILICGADFGGGAGGTPFTDTDSTTTIPPRPGLGYGAVLDPTGTTVEHVASLSDSGVSDCAFSTIDPSYYLVGRSDSGVPGTSMIPGMTGWGFVVQVDPDDDPNVAGDDLVFTSRIGVNSTIPTDVVVDASGNIVILLATSNQTGPDVDAWVGPSSFQTRNDEVAMCKLATALGANALLACTYLGGTATEAQGAINVDPLGNLYTLLTTNSADFPTAPGGPIAVPGELALSRLSPSLGALDFSAFYPRYLFGVPSAIEVLDTSDAAFIVRGGTASWPVTTCAITPTDNGSDLAVTDATAQNILFATHLPGMSATELASLPGGRVAVAGGISGAFFGPLVNGYGATPTNSGLMVLSTSQTCTDVSIDGTASTNLPERGDVVTFSLLAENTGAADAAGVGVTFELPPILTVVSLTSPRAPCLFSSGGASCALGGLAASASVALELVAIASSTGAAQVRVQISTTDTDLDPANDQVLFGLSVGPPNGPCGAVSIYGECMQDTLRICDGRNTANEMLLLSDCAATGGACVPAQGRLAAHCQAAPPTDAGFVDGGFLDGGFLDGTVPDGAAGDTGSPADTGTSAQDTGVSVSVDTGTSDVKEDSGCGCSTEPAARSSSSIAWMILLALPLCRRRR